MFHFKKNSFFYIIAFITISIWSSTFISTKVILSALSPVEIIIYRFILAYLILFCFHPHSYKPESIGTELLILSAGFTGGSIYFLAENYALYYSMPSNVALIVSTAPIFTIICSKIFLRNETITKFFVIGGIISFTGVILVILNGAFILHFNPKGDLLALLAAICWSFYSIAIKKIKSKYPDCYITRKIFFWGVISSIPFFFITGTKAHFSALLCPQIFLNLILLSLFASAICYVMWNKTVIVLGASKVSNFIYLIPLFTSIESSLILNEYLSIYAIIGGFLIFIGLITTSIEKK